MYRVGIEKFVVGSNLDVSVIREEEERNTHYVFLKIGIFGKSVYGVCVLGDGHSLEMIGEDPEEAGRLFDLLVKELVEPCHVFEIVTDFKKERLIEEN